MNTEKWNLNIRDENGKIINSVKRWEKVELLTDNLGVEYDEMEYKNRTYIKIKTNDGKTWYVAEDFLIIWAKESQVEEVQQQPTAAVSSTPTQVAPAVQSSTSPESLIPALSTDQLSKIEAWKSVEVAKWRFTNRDSERNIENHDNNFVFYKNDWKYVLEMNWTRVFSDDKITFDKIPSKLELDIKISEMIEKIKNEGIVETIGRIN